MRLPHAPHAAQYFDDLRPVPREIVVNELKVHPKTASLSGTKLIRYSVGPVEPRCNLSRPYVSSRPIWRGAHKLRKPRWHLRPLPREKAIVLPKGRSSRRIKCRMAPAEGKKTH